MTDYEGVDMGTIDERDARDARRLRYARAITTVPVRGADASAITITHDETIEIL